MFLKDRYNTTLTRDPRSDKLSLFGHPAGAAGAERMAERE